ncbi:MAG: DUF695 domain-containing protein [Myxococcota bacterium]
MEPLWQENFDFYEAKAKTGRAIVALDLAAREHAPVASHPVRLQFRVKMQHARTDGLRSAEESEALFALEDRLVEAVRTKLEGLYVARAVAYGYTEFFFYVPLAHRATDASVLPDAGEYQLEWFAEDDAEWARYGELFPDRWSLQTIFNRRIVAQMQEAGDQLDVPRQVDHVAFFPSRLQATAAAEALRGADFQVDEPEAPEKSDEPWMLEFHRDDHCADGEPDEFVAEVLELIEPHEGDYDGWGAPVVRPS